jgi:hypothetical protein
MEEQQGEVEQPRCPTMLELIKKCHLLPSQGKKYGHCHCHQFKATGRDRVHGTCPIGYLYAGNQYAFLQCPICLCMCNAFIDLAQYHAIVAVTMLPTS